MQERRGSDRMETKNRFKIKKWHRGLACMLVVSLLLVTFTQYYECRLGTVGAVPDGSAVVDMTAETDIIPEVETDRAVADISNMGELCLSEESSMLRQTVQGFMDYCRELEQQETKDWNNSLNELAGEIEDYQEQIEDWNQETREFLEDAGSEELLARQTAFEEDIQERFTELNEQLEQVDSEEEFATVVQSIQSILNGDTEDYTPIYGEQLPNEVEEGSEEIETVEETEVGSSVGFYAAEQTEYTEAELCTEGLTALSDEMKTLAEELDTPLQIYLYLKNNIHYELYYGSRKGAVATYDSLAGNDKDQASLLIAMLRHQGYPARYAGGIIYLDAEQAMNLTNTEDVTLAAQVFVKLGTPVTLVADKNGPAGIKLYHTWVEAYVPYEDYRGAGNNGGKAMWIPLDTSVKAYEDSDSMFHHLEEMGLSDAGMQQIAEAYGTECYDKVMAQWEGPLNQLVEENPELTLMNRKIVPEELGYLPLSLQYPVVEPDECYAEISDGESDRITFSLNGVMLATMTAAELYSHRLTVVYVPAEEADEAVLEQYGSVFEAPSYLIRMRAALMLDGEAVAYGEPLSPGSIETFTMKVSSGIQTDVIDNQIMAGGMYQITIDMQTMTEQELTGAVGELETASEELKAVEEGLTAGDIYTDGILGRLLDCAGKTYFAHVDIADRILAEYMGINATRTLSVGMTGYTVTPIVMMGSVAGLEEGSLFIDIDLDSHGVVSLNGDKAEEQRYMLTSGMISSVCESYIWEELLGVEAVSTIAVLNQACQEGIEVYALCSKNYEEYRSKLNVNASVLAAVDSAIASGMIVTIPAETIQMGDWVGTGYMVTNPDTMATAYMISGGLNGGYTQEQIEMAFIGNAMLDVLDIALSVAGIVSIVSMFSMGPVGIALGVVFSVLTVVAIGIAVYAIYNNFQQMEAYIEGEISGDAIVNGFIWNAVLTAATLGLSKGVEKGLTYAAERYLTKVVGSRLAGGLLSEGTSPMQLVNAIKRLKALGYTDDFLRELADNISASQLIRLNQLNSKGLSRDMLDVLMLHSRKLGNYSDDLIWKLEKAGGYYDDILKLVDDYGEVFTQQLDMEGLTRLGRLAKEGLPPDVAEAVIKHIDNFADYSNDTIKKIVESGCNADRILTKIDEYAKDFTEDLTAGQLKRIDDILEQGITPEQFEVLLQHADGLENYTDEVVELWRNYGGNSDDFLKLVDEFGEEFVEAFEKNGDEAVTNWLENATIPSRSSSGIPKGNYAIESSRGLIRQNEAANLLASQGYEVIMLDEIVGGNGYGINPDSNPDFLIEGRVFDVYSPDNNTSTKTIIRTISDKTTKQADRIILNLDDYNQDLISLKNDLLSRVGGDLKRLQELKVIRNGVIETWYVR